MLPAFSVSFRWRVGALQKLFVYLPMTQTDNAKIALGRKLQLETPTTPHISVLFVICPDVLSLLFLQWHDTQEGQTSTHGLAFLS